MNLELMKSRKKELGLTNAQVAERSGVSLGTVNKIFSGAVNNPGIKTIKSLEDALEFIVDHNTAMDPGELIVFHDSAFEEAYAGRNTVEDFYNYTGDRRIELIDGVFYNMTAPYVRHQEIISRLYFEIQSYINKKGGKCKVLFSPVDVQIDDYTIVEPDLIIVCDESKITERNIFGAPDFVLEVVSKSTRTRDYYIKGKKYAEAGVREYWIVDYLKGKVQVYRNIDGDFVPSLYSETDMIPLGIFEDLLIDMSRV